MNESNAKQCLMGMLDSRKEAINENQSLQVAIDLILSRQKDLSCQIKSIEEQIVELLDSQGVDRIETSIGTAAMINGKPSVEIIDIASIPPQFKTGSAKIPFVEVPEELFPKFEITANKILIAAAFKDGDVPGAQMNTGKKFLKIT